MSSRPAGRSYGFAMLLFAVITCIWGYNWIVMKIGLRYAPPFDFAALRAVCATTVLFTLLLLRGRGLRPQAPRGTVLLGLLQTTGFIGISTWALSSGAVGKTSVLVFTMPFWVLLLGWPLLGERVRGPQWLAVGLAAAGLLLIIEPWHLHASLLSEGLALTAGATWASASIVARRVQRNANLDVLSLTAWQMLCGTIPLVVLAWAVPAPAPRWGWQLAVALFYVSVLGMALAWSLWVYLLKRLPAGTAGLNALAIPAFAVITAWLQLGERPSASELAGMLCVGLALALISALSIRETRRFAAGPAALQRQR